SNSDGKQRPVTLERDWEATANGSYTTAFFTTLNATYFYQGALYMNGSQMNILLDLNGHKLDRKLTAARSNGFVIYVNGTGNKLEIADSSEDHSGMITGGFSTNQAAAIYVPSGQLTLTGGNITGNRGLYGAVWIYNAAPTATLTLGGSADVYGNTMYNDANKVQDIRLQNASSLITITSKLTGTEKMGVYREGRGFITKDFGKYNSTADATSLFFSANSPDYEVIDSGAGTGMEAMYWCYSNVLNWSYACQQSIQSNGSQQTVILYSDWKAVADSNYTTAFGTDSYYWYGNLYVPAGANIVLDLRGYTVDRALASGREYGAVIRVNGKLKIVDTSAKQTGKITGGFNTRNDYQGGGAVSVYSNGELTVTSGTITGNYGQWA
ncbi:MAG: hypothetical protein K2L87_06795, partial [Clostridiales bacterium]|nr:hypothetical protein [Clostridiales bacterium]